MKHELIQVSDNIRVESGPERKTAVATEELLSNSMTADHYQIGNGDARGVIIDLGKPMEYLDYLGDPVWYVYQLVADDTTDTGERWKLVTVEKTKELALLAAGLLEE